MEIDAKTFIPLVKGPVDTLLAFLGEELKQIISNRLIEYQAEEYKRNFYTKTLLHRAEPVKLMDFYQPLFISTYKHSSSNSLSRIATDDVKAFFKLARCITLIGNAGSGKSTLLKYLSVKCIDENFKIPIKIELRYLNNMHENNIHSYITEQIFHFQKLGVSVNKIDDLLSKNYFVFFFDGYDELTSSIRANVAKDIDSFIEKYPNNNYVITSRPYTNIELMPLFNNYVISDLSANEINLFIRKQIPNDERELADKLIILIQNWFDVS